MRVETTTRSLQKATKEREPAVSEKGTRERSVGKTQAAAPREIVSQDG
jgi:hypothetical protein